MVKLEGVEVRCSRCDQLLCIQYTKSTVFMQYSELQLDKKKILDAEGNEVAEGNKLRCRNCFKLNRLPFQIANAIPKPAHLDRPQTSKEIDWIFDRMISGKREPKIDPLVTGRCRPSFALSNAQNETYR